MRVCKVARHSEALAVTFMVFLKVSQSGLAVVLMLMGFATAGFREGMEGNYKSNKWKETNVTVSKTATTSILSA
ncbi:Hcn1 [Symbiodinium necroappetens]|uniref:Hcn1 protein n=1 Tax=Symbiodinium necroappetens TaxID=1628268 RepID=A0A812S5Y9_9DINO|nr:Hcn1 [Symbiodinium necroappetens]